MRIVAEEKLTEDQLSGIYHHYAICNENDGTQYAFDEDLDFRNEGEINTFALYENDEILATLSLFAPTKKEAEIIALTRPDQRGKGYFTLLWEEAVKEMSKRGIGSFLFVCDRASLSGMEVMKHLKVNYGFSEYLMAYADKAVSHRAFDSLDLVEAEQKDMARYIQINRSAFGMEEDESSGIVHEFFASDQREIFGIKYGGDLIGMIGIYKEQARFYVHGFCIDEKYRHKGIGTAVLRLIVEICRERDRGRAIELEVQTENENALNVYKNLGFQVKTEFRYYRESLGSRE